ncbi:MAG: tRNA lysidine(34) synthetase TilS [Cyanobacteria bacterium SIG28]|nr:tRNA lysidine(34) synthetase TilS [Cyanobacteria bacterium SIG28]
MPDIQDKVAEFLIENNLQDKTIILGFSGGYDSMCLLDVLSKLRQKAPFFELSVIAAHFNHNWRGEESLKEQEVCRLFAASRGFEFYTKMAPVGLKKTENEARIARYEFFEDTLEYFDADVVFTAHNRDDNAETVLYRVIKGTGVVGLKGISQKRGCFYRPLLTSRRSEIVDYCEKNNLLPNNDSSNADIKYFRNYIRLNIIPMLEKINPQVKDSLNTLAEVAKSDDLIIEEYISTLRGKVLEGDRIISKNYLELSEPVKKRIIHEYIQQFDLDYDFKKINELYDFIEKNITKRNGSTISLATALWLYVDERYIETIPRKEETAIPTNKEILIEAEGEYKIGDKILLIKPYVSQEVFVFPEATANFVYVDLSKIKTPIVARTRRDGDIINPFGMQGSMKLKKYLNSKGVNRHRRDEILLLAKDDEILWVAGVGLSNKIAVDKTPTHVIEVL